MNIVENEHPDFDRLWTKLLRNHDNPTALISKSYFDYRALYLGPSLKRKLAFLVVERDLPILGSKFELIRDNADQLELNAVASPSAVIVAAGAPPSLRLGAETLLRKRLEEVVQEIGATRLTFVDQILGGGLSALTHWALAQGASIECQFNQVVDLTIDEQILWRGLTKSCQWGVNWGRKNLVVSVHTNAVSVEELRHLHLEAAGHETRSRATWALQGKMLEEEEAFLITAQLGGTVVSSAYFQLSPADCYYGVSASDRRLFDKPLSHAIIWEAIRYARQRGCSRFTLGNQVWERFRWHLPPPSPKEVNISKFKRSFGGNSRPEFIVTLPVSHAVTHAQSASAEPSSPLPSTDREVILKEVVPFALKDPDVSHGSRVYLRPLTPADITEPYIAWFADEAVTRHLEVRAITHDEARSYIEEGLTTNKYFMCAICDLQSGVHIGNIKIGPIRWKHRVSDMVTVIGDQTYWGRGVASDAIRLAVRVAFRFLGMRKLHASMYASNVGSLRAYTRAGWSVEARLAQQGILDNSPNDIILISYFNTDRT